MIETVQHITAGGSFASTWWSAVVSPSKAGTTNKKLRVVRWSDIVVSSENYRYYWIEAKKKYFEEQLQVKHNGSRSW